jgi:transmembrane 9 superfamily protein 2/4
MKTGFFLFSSFTHLFRFLSIMFSKVKSGSLLLLAASSMVSGFYLPGMAPHDFADGDDVPLYVNSLTPMSNSQVKSVISYDYYFDRLHFCQPKEGLQNQAESLGSILFGDRIFTSPFEVRP